MEKGNNIQCHWLPCSIDYDGMAPINTFFQPEVLTREISPSETASTINRNTTHAVSFRGRGLLSNTNSQATSTLLNNNHVIGTIITHDTIIHPHTNESNAIITMKEQFDTMFEWEHESNENKLLSADNHLEEWKLRREKGDEDSKDCDKKGWEAIH